MEIGDPAGSEVRVRVFTPCCTFILGPLTSCRGSEFQFHFHGPSCLGRTAAAMPRKFNVRQLRETGQCFENFLLVQGLDMETNREQLRIIYNQNFKTRYGRAPCLARIAGPAHRHDPRRRGHPSRASVQGRSSRSGSGRSRGRGGADVPSRLVPTPLPCLSEPARQALPWPGPCTKVPAESLPGSPLP